MGDFLQYEGKTVVITGCASGMGRSTAQRLLELGAQVHGVDFQPCDLPLAAFSQLDLRDFAAIDRVADDVSESIHALFNCAGLPQTSPSMDVMRVNYLGTRKLTEKLVPRIVEGGAIASIASTAGLGWSRRLPTLLELLAIDGIDAAATWCEAHADVVQEGYAFSKEMVIAWTMWASAKLIKQGIRVNCTLPGPTETPMMREFESATPSAVLDAALQPIGRRSTADEQAAALLYLNSSRSSYVNGVVLPVDGGFMAGLASGQIDPSFMMRAA